MSIPKIVFQTSKNKPEQYVIDKIVKKCPGWEYIHYNDEEIFRFFNENPLDEFKNIKEKFHSMPTGAHKADLFRYYFLYVKGGVYIDSDAMIEIPMEEIVKDYSFFSVRSSFFPNTIFQGFIGSTPCNDIMYMTLKDAYHINTEELSRSYHLLCLNLYKILFNNHFNHSKMKIKLYHESTYNRDCAKVYNDANQIILLHYWRDKTIPL